MRHLACATSVLSIQRQEQGPEANYMSSLAFCTHSDSYTVNQVCRYLFWSRNQSSIPASDAFLTPGQKCFSPNNVCVLQTYWLGFL
jgi:hypothetical protein